MRSDADFDRRIVAARISAPTRETAVDNERVSAALDRYPVDRVGCAGRTRKRCDAGRNRDPERAFDPDLFEAGDAEVARCRRGGGNDRRRGGNDNEEGAHAATFLQHGYASLKSSELCRNRPCSRCTL